MVHPFNEMFIRLARACVCVFQISNDVPRYVLNVCVILFSCHCIIRTIVTLKLRSSCAKVNLIAFLKVTRLLVCLKNVKK